jgi:hypothetical protein
MMLRPVEAEYVRIAAAALGSQRVARPPVLELPKPEAHEKPSFWQWSPNARAVCHVRYAIRLARLIAERYGLVLEHGDFKFVSLPDAAGRVTVQGRAYFIEISLLYRGDSEAVASIMAHEFAHVFLAKQGIHLTPKLRNEELTDTTAILAGFGPLMTRTCQRTRTYYYVFGYSSKTTFLGYLKRPAVVWLTDLQQRIALGQVIRLRSLFDPAERGYTLCPGCLSQLRLPQRTARILLTCSVCHLKQELRLELGSASRKGSLLQRLREVVLRYLDRRDGIPISRFPRLSNVRGLTALAVVALVWVAIQSDKSSTPPQAHGPNTSTPQRAPAPIASYVRSATAPNGESWPVVADYVRGYPRENADGLSTVTVDNSRNDADVFVKLVSLDGLRPSPVRMFFIPAQGSFTLTNVTAGRYDIRYRDLSSGQLSRTEGFSLEEISSSDATQYSSLTMTLYKVRDGNMQTYGLSEAEF